MRFLHFLLAAAVLLAPALPAPVAGAPQACSGRERRQFDFWLGYWRVTDASGKLHGTDVVTSAYGGCVLQEHWTGSGGDVGSSFNTYMPGRKEWHQTWVDSGGVTLILFGRLQGTSMVLQAPRKTAGGTVIDRITWTPLPDGRVRKHWQQSRYANKPWQDVYDEYYTHVESR